MNLLHSHSAGALTIESSRCRNRSTPSADTTSSPPKNRTATSLTPAASDSDFSPSADTERQTPKGAKTVSSCSCKSPNRPATAARRTPSSPFASATAPTPRTRSRITPDADGSQPRIRMPGRSPRATTGSLSPEPAAETTTRLTQNSTHPLSRSHKPTSGSAETGHSGRAPEQAKGKRTTICQALARSSATSQAASRRKINTCQNKARMRRNFPVNPRP
jgi:hypothetical protein